MKFAQKRVMTYKTECPLLDRLAQRKAMTKANKGRVSQ